MNSNITSTSGSNNIPAGIDVLMTSSILICVIFGLLKFESPKFLRPLSTSICLPS